MPSWLLPADPPEAWVPGTLGGEAHPTLISGEAAHRWRLWALAGESQFPKSSDLCGKPSRFAEFRAHLLVNISSTIMSFEERGMDLYSAQCLRFRVFQQLLLRVLASWVKSRKHCSFVPYLCISHGWLVPRLAGPTAGQNENFHCTCSFKLWWCTFFLF